MLDLVAKLDFRHNDEELERLIKEYKEAKGALQGYLFHEGFDLNIQTRKKPEEQQEAASGN